jgi:hypothetical protein
MAQTMLQTVVFEIEECCKCGIVFAMPGYLKRRRYDEGGLFYCPNGHGQHYAKSEVQRLREKLDEQTREATRQAARAASAEQAEHKTKLEINRLKKRVSNGVCPCCNRTFKQLARHMECKHPEYKAK